MELNQDTVKTLTDDDLAELIRFTQFLAGRKAHKEGKDRADPSITLTILKNELTRRGTHADESDARQD